MQHGLLLIIFGLSLEMCLLPKTPLKHWIHIQILKAAEEEENLSPKQGHGDAFWETRPCFATLCVGVLPAEIYAQPLEDPVQKLLLKLFSHSHLLALLNFIPRY